MEAVKIWDVESHQELLTLYDQGALYTQTAFSPDGNILGSMNAAGRLKLWQAPSWEEIRKAEASPARREAISDWSRRKRPGEPGKDHLATQETKNAFGVLRREQGQYQDANDLLCAALAGRREKLGDDHPATLQTVHELGLLFLEQGQYDKAEPLLLEAVEGRRLKLGDEHPHTQESLKNLIELYEAWDKPDEVEKWRRKLSD